MVSTHWNKPAKTTCGGLLSDAYFPRKLNLPYGSKLVGEGWSHVNAFIF